MSKKHAGLSVWHLTMLALGTVVGGSFFLGSGVSIRAAGPGVLISYLFGGLLVYLILTALSEMTVGQQASGAFRTYAEQMFGPAAGFITGWVYWTGLTLAMSSEATAASIFIAGWIPGISLPTLAALIIIVVTLTNLIGARTLTTLESGLALIKLAAIGVFIIIALALIIGLLPGRVPVGLGALTQEPFLPAGLAGIAGSMLIVMFTYAGFEIIGLAASEAENPHRTIPRAILFTICSLFGLYFIATVVLLPLMPTARLSDRVSPLVSGLTSAGLTWAADVINIVLIIAILSTMLAAMFGLGRMVRSLADSGYAPKWLQETADVPKRGIIFSGVGMLAGVALANMLPAQVYLFLVSSGGFALLFVYVIIMATHFKFRRVYGCPPKGNCQLRGYPYTSLLGIAALIAILISMPLVPGQGSGLLAGLSLVVLFSVIYLVFKSFLGFAAPAATGLARKPLSGRTQPDAGTETAEELKPKEDCKNKT